MVGGLITSTVLTLIVIPAIYYMWRGRGLKETVLEGENTENKDQS
jgi:Cu(I)/Ag(I) efflux system membrane protein CusA/SilA